MKANRVRGAALIGILLLIFCALPAFAQTAQKAQPSAISLAGTERVLGLGRYANPDNNRTPLMVESKPAGLSFSYRVYISNADVLGLEYLPEEGRYYLVARSEGSARVTVTSANNKRATISVQVRDFVPISNIRITPAKLVLNIGDAPATLNVSFSPSTADYPVLPDGRTPFYWSSSNESVARVDAQGRVYPGTKAGTAVVTCAAQDGGKAKARVKVTVKAVKARSILLNQTMIQLDAGGGSLALEPRFQPANTTDQRVGWKSSNTKVARVDANGVVTGIRPGTATITCTSVSGRKKASCKVRVGYFFEGVTCRALGIFNSDYADQPMPGAHGCADMFGRAMCNLSYAGETPDVDVRRNLTGTQMVLALSSLADCGADENDITIIYYAGQGAYSALARERGALMGVDGALVSADTVRRALDRVPGTVVIILDSSLSGQFIASKGAGTRWVDNWIETFSNGTTARALTDSPKKDKYKILTACEALQYAHSYEDYTLFGYCFGKAAGTDFDAGLMRGEMQADANRDDVVTLDELYRCMYKLALKEARDPYSRQYVQVWPPNDCAAVLARN